MKYRYNIGMETIIPESPTQLQQRDTLLQESLRPDPLPFTIRSEYPIVLNPANRHQSICIKNQEQIVAHANLFPRYIVQSNQITKYKIGLIGNVATAPGHRGQGISRTLFTELFKSAHTKDLNGVILWSDLTSFYQKMGFSSYGSELRITIDAQHLDKIKRNMSTRHFLPISNISKGSLLSFNRLRSAATVTLERSSEEFEQLLTIPETHLFTDSSRSGYCIIGRGFDMVGVIHEWAAENPSDLLAMIGSVLEVSGYDSLMLLAPKSTPDPILSALQTVGGKVEPHDSFHYHCFSKEPEFLDLMSQLFVWGMDSI